ncbi:MAG: hypothetical protein AB1668_07250 [Nanoarchaeota archaeon]
METLKLLKLNPLKLNPLKLNLKHLFALVSALLLVFSLAQAAGQQTAGQKQTDLFVKAQLEGKEIPSLLSKYISNSKMNVELTLENGDKALYGVITAEKKIANVVPGGINNPSLNVYATEQVVKKIQAADNPVAELQKALQEKEIRWEGVGFLNKVKYSFAAMFFNLGRLFGSDLSKEASKESAKVVSKEQAKGEKLDEPEETEPTSVDIRKAAETAEPVKSAISGGITGAATADVSGEQGAEHVVKMTENGFVPEKLTIKAGDTVRWENERTGKLSKAMILGTRSCINVKSGIFTTGQSFSWTFDKDWTFDKEKTCTIIDGIMIKKVMDITIE